MAKDFIGMKTGTEKLSILYAIMVNRSIPHGSDFGAKYALPTYKYNTHTHFHQFPASHS